jgi:hypothetical protein
MTMGRISRQRPAPPSGARQHTPYPPTVEVNPDNATARYAGGGSTAAERNADLHDAAQAAARRSHMTRVVARIVELLALLSVGCEVGDELRRLQALSVEFRTSAGAAAP